jgi:hypothetical protein
MKKWIVAGTFTVAAVASAQPAPLANPDDDDPPGSGSDARSAGSAAPAPVMAPANPYPEKPAPAPAPPPPPPKPRPKDPHVDMPEVLTTPTGWLLPAAVLYSRTSLDTGGGFSSDNRVGLGDVAEFGIATTDRVRMTTPMGAPDAIQPYVTATFRIGVGENRLFEGQPGLVLGFVKSFERDYNGYKTRIAELTLVMSKHVGPRAAFHVGGSFWDASLQGQGLDETLHDGSGHWSAQVRGFGGVELRPLDKSSILIDAGYAPEFCPTCDAGKQIQLRPEMSWGVRYEVADWIHLESGVRLAEIGDANLLDAQIFGQVTFTSWALRHVVDDLK